VGLFIESRGVAGPGIMAKTEGDLRYDFTTGPFSTGAKTRTLTHAK
jgi:hypothetical protein